MVLGDEEVLTAWGTSSTGELVRRILGLGEGGDGRATGGGERRRGVGGKREDVGGCGERRRGGLGGGCGCGTGKVWVGRQLFLRRLFHTPGADPLDGVWIRLGMEVVRGGRSAGRGDGGYDVLLA